VLEADERRSVERAAEAGGGHVVEQLAYLACSGCGRKRCCRCTRCCQRRGVARAARSREQSLRVRPIALDSRQSVREEHPGIFFMRILVR